jgi:hypothetical protein
VSLFTYLWHYTVARLVYDDFVRHRGPSALVLAALVLAVALLRRRRRRVSLARGRPRVPRRRQRRGR